MQGSMVATIASQAVAAAVHKCWFRSIAPCRRHGSDGASKLYPRTCLRTGMCVGRCWSSRVLDRHYPSWLSSFFRPLCMVSNNYCALALFFGGFPTCKFSREYDLCAKLSGMASQMSAQHRHTVLRIQRSMHLTKNGRSDCSFYTPSHLTITLTSLLEKYYYVSSPFEKLLITSSALTITALIDQCLKRCFIAPAKDVIVPSYLFASFYEMIRSA